MRGQCLQLAGKALQLIVPSRLFVTEFGEETDGEERDRMHKEQRVTGVQHTKLRLCVWGANIHMRACACVCVCVICVHAHAHVCELCWVGRCCDVVHVERVRTIAQPRAYPWSSSGQS